MDDPTVRTIINGAVGGLFALSMVFLKNVFGLAAKRQAQAAEEKRLAEVRQVEEKKAEQVRQIEQIKLEIQSAADLRREYREEIDRRDVVNAKLQERIEKNEADIRSLNEQMLALRQQLLDAQSTIVKLEQDKHLLQVDLTRAIEDAQTRGGRILELERIISEYKRVEQDLQSRIRTMEEMA